MADPIAELVRSYFELNTSTIEELAEEPSPLEFMRYVASNRPFVIRHAAHDWEATQKWSATYLTETLRNQCVNVAVTPFGNADAPTFNQDGKLLFAKPHEEDQSFEDFLTYLIQHETDPSISGSEIRYAQTQNDNLRHEYVSLFSQVQKSIPFARIALQKEPEAINLWIGSSKSVTAMHRDNYENIYVQVAGKKHFVLLPSLCQPCINEQALTPAIYVRTAEGLALQEEHGDVVPFPTWDPDDPLKNETPYSHLAKPMRVTLEPGDMLYLPAMWYHKVSQSCSAEGICVAVNYWYDMDFNGPLYPLTSFVRDVSLARA